MKAKSDVLAELEVMLRDVFAAKAQGKAYGRLARAHGYVDGYMRAVLELEVVTKDEVLELVRAERERIDGPATRTLTDFGEFVAA